MARHLTAVLLILLVGITSAHTWETPVPLSEEPTNEFISYNSRTSAIVRDGVLHYVYYADQIPGDDSTRDVFYMSYDIEDETWSDPVNLSNATGLSHLPVIVMEQDGDINVFWYDTRVNSNYDLYWNRFEASTGLWRGAEPIAQDSARWATHPVAVVDSADVVHLMWLENTYNGSWIDDIQIFYNTIVDGQLQDPLQLTNIADYNRGTPCLTIDSNNNLHLAWSDSRSGPNDWHVYYRQKPCSGVWGDEIHIDQGQATDLEISDGYLYLAYNKSVEPSGHYQTFYTVKPLTDPDDNWWPSSLMSENDTKSRLGVLEPSYKGMRLVWIDHLDDYFALYETRIGPYNFSRPEPITTGDGIYSAAVLVSDDDGTLYRFYNYRPTVEDDFNIYYSVDYNPNPSGTDGLEEGESGGTGAVGVLLGLYPSPVQQNATVALELDEADEVELAVYDLSGRRVRTLQQGSLPAGRHEISLDSAGMTTGVYLLRLSTSSGEEVQRFVIER